MTKTQVIEKLGEPLDTAAIEGQENLNYKFCTQKYCDVVMQCSRYERHMILLRDNKVVSYGRPGDFEMSVLPTRRSKSEITIKNE